MTAALFKIELLALESVWVQMFPPKFVWEYLVSPKLSAGLGREHQNLAGSRCKLAASQLCCDRLAAQSM
jgi:hypothetical protein